MAAASGRRIARLLAAAALSLAPGAATGDPLADRIDGFVRAEMERQRVPGVAVAVVEDGKVVHTAGYGYANVEHRAPVGAETVFQSGSLGKQFTAAAVMLLVEDGKLSLSDPVAKHLPGAPESWRDITLTHLLTHTSGIPDYTAGTIDLRRDYSEDELMRLAFGLELAFPPGSRWSYSNTGYLLLGIVIHKASGRFYGDLLRERVFEPLGMKTARIISEADIVPNRAAGYRLVDGELKNQEWVAPALNTTADGSLYLSVLDFVAWDAGLRRGAILSPGSWARVFEPVRLRSGKTYPYGFGWGLEEVAGQKVQRHGGAWQGFRTSIARYLGDGLTVVALANSADADPERFVEGIAAIVDPALAPPEPTPIPDREPEVTARLAALLEAAAGNRLSRAELAYAGAGFFPEVADEYAKLLGGLGKPTRIDLLARRELGDDRVYDYEVALGQKRLLATLGLAPDGKVSLLEIRPR